MVMFDSDTISIVKFLLIWTEIIGACRNLHKQIIIS